MASFPASMSDTSSDTLSEVSDPIPNPPIYPRSRAKSYATRASVTQWMENAPDHTDDPTAIDFSSPGCSDLSPPAPIERSALRMLPAKKPIRPPRQAARAFVRQRLPSNVLMDNNSAVVVPFEDPYETMKDGWRLSPRLSPDTPDNWLYHDENDKVDLEDWLNVEKVRLDGHMKERIAEAVEVAPEATQHPHDEQTNKQTNNKGQEVVPSLEVGEDFFNQVDQLAECLQQPVDNEVVDQIRQPPPFYDPDEPMRSIETAYDDVQVPADNPSSPTHNSDLLEPAEVVFNNIAVLMQPENDTETTSVALKALDEHLQLRKQSAESTTNNSTARMKPEGHLGVTNRVPKDYEEHIKWQQRSDPKRVLRGETAKKQADFAKRKSGDFDVVRCLTQAQEDMYPDFTHASQQHGLQLNPENYHLPDQVELHRQPPLPRLKPAIWGDGTVLGIQIVQQFSNEAIQEGLQLDDFQDAIMRGDFDLVLHEYVGNVSDLDEPLMLQGHHCIQPDQQRHLFILPDQDPFLDNLNRMNNDCGSVQDNSSSHTVTFQPPLLGNSPVGNIDFPGGTYVGFQHRLSANEVVQQPHEYQEPESSRTADLQYFLVDQAEEQPIQSYGDQEMGSSSTARNQSPQLVDRFTNAQLISAGQEFIRRRHDAIRRGLSSDVAFDAIFDELALSQELKNWLAAGHDKVLKLPPRSTSLLSKSRTFGSCQELRELYYQPLTFYQIPSPRRSTCLPLDDSPSDYELNDKDFEDLVENANFNLLATPPRNCIGCDNKSKRVCVRGEVSTIPEVDMDGDMNMAIDSPPSAESLLSMEHVAIPDLEKEVAPSGVSGASMYACHAAPAEDADVEMVLDMAASPFQDLLPSPNKTTAFETERQIASTNDNTSPPADPISSPSTLGPEPDILVNLKGFPKMDIDIPSQGVLISEPELQVKSTAAATCGSSTDNFRTSGFQKSNFSFIFKAVAETSSSDAEMDLVESEDEVDVIQTSPAHLAPIFQPSVPAPAPKALPVDDKRSKALKSTYKKQEYQDKSTKSVFQKVKKRSQQPASTGLRLQGPVEGSHYNAADALRNGQSMRRQPPSMMASPQNPYRNSFGQGARFQDQALYSQFQVHQVPQNPQGGPAPCVMNTGFASQIQNQMPQYAASAFGLNAGKAPHGFLGMRPVDVRGYVPPQDGDNLAGHDRCGQGHCRGGSMGPGYLNNQRDDSRHMQKNTVSFRSPPLSNNLSQGLSTFMSCPDGSYSRGKKQDNSPTPNQRKAPGLDPRSQESKTYLRLEGTGTQKLQPSQTLAQLPPPQQQTLPVPNVLPSASSQLKRNYVVLAFHLLDNFQKSWTTLRDAKQREGKRRVQILMENDPLLGRKIRVTGPLDIGLRDWVTATVPGAKQVSWGTY